MSWTTVLKSLQALLAHSLLLCFTILLVLKLDHSLIRPWWVVFSPLWMFHGLVARGRFSLPAPESPHGRHWAPYHAVMATPLLLSFEMLLCVYLQTSFVVSLKIVFLPLLAFMLAVFVDNIRMCRALMPGDDENMSDEAIWRTLPHFWVAISAVFFIAASVFTLLKLCGDIDALGWWDLFINFGIAEFFAFLICTKWYNPDIHRSSYTREAGSSSMTIRYLDWNGGLIVSSNEEQMRSRCNLQEIGGHLMKIPVITFQILLFMHLEGTPASAKNMPVRALFIPVFMMQGAAVSYTTYRLVEKIVFRLKKGAPCEKYILFSSTIREYFGFVRHGSRLLGWWSIDESSQEERARLFCTSTSGYNTFPPERVKKMTKSDLVEQIWKLHASLCEQTEVTTFSQQEYERLQHEKILCRVCFEDEINTVLLPCRHHSFCSSCCDKCKNCPICRISIEARLRVHDA